MNKNLFIDRPDGPKNDAEINRFISLYGGLTEPVDFLGDARRSLELLWELVTAAYGHVAFEYTIGACLISGGGAYGKPVTRASAGSVGRAIAELFLKFMEEQAKETIERQSRVAGLKPKNSNTKFRKRPTERKK